MFLTMTPSGLTSAVEQKISSEAVSPPTHARDSPSPRLSQCLGSPTRTIVQSSTQRTNVPSQAGNPKSTTETRSSMSTPPRLWKRRSGDSGLK
jgi:hypothetical protein